MYIQLACFHNLCSLDSRAICIYISLRNVKLVNIKQLEQRNARPGRNKQSRETVVQPWDKVLVLHQRKHTISLSCFADTETLSRWEKVRWYAIHKHVDPDQLEPKG